MRLCVGSLILLGCGTTAGYSLPKLLPQMKATKLLPQMKATNTAASLAQAAAAAVAAPLLLASEPAIAVAEASDIPDSVNTVLTVFVLGFVAFIGKFALEFATETASQVDERADRLGFNRPREPRQRVVSNLYDDTDYSYKSNQKAVENSRTRKTKSKQIGNDGKRFAPWMVIDEKKVAQVKATRTAAKKAKKAGEGKGWNPFS